MNDFEIGKESKRNIVVEYVARTISADRYLQGGETETVEHKLKILERECKYIIWELTDWKDFVFANALKKEAYAHCTHLQIAQADSQTKICKRVQLPQSKRQP